MGLRFIDLIRQLRERLTCSNACRCLPVSFVHITLPSRLLCSQLGSTSLN